jgi:hypothetical protein
LGLPGRHGSVGEGASRDANSRNAHDVVLDPGIGTRLSRDLAALPVNLPGGPHPLPAPPACSPFERVAEQEVLTTVATDGGGPP